MGYVALEVPLRPFSFRRRRQRHHAAVPRVEQGHDPLDHATLAGRVAALEQDHDAQVPISDPFFELDELDLQAPELLLVLLACERERSLLLLLGRHRG